MPIVEVTVPQMGEGLHEVLIVEFQKKPGDTIRRDEPIYHMETDKATMEVESPHDGILVEWLAQEGDTVPIGAPIARMDVKEAASTNGSGGLPVGASPMAALSEGVATGGADIRERNIPPRTRAYAREKGIGDEELMGVPAAGPKLMPNDIDAYLEGREAQPPVAAEASEETEGEPGEYTERPLSKQDRTFIYRLKRSAAMVVPAVAKRQMDWGSIRAFADARKAAAGADGVQPTAFQSVAW